MPFVLPHEQYRTHECVVLHGRLTPTFTYDNACTQQPHLFGGVNHMRVGLNAAIAMVSLGGCILKFNMHVSAPNHHIATPPSTLWLPLCDLFLWPHTTTPQRSARCGSTHTRTRQPTIRS